MKSVVGTGWLNKKIITFLLTSFSLSLIGCAGGGGDDPGYGGGIHTSTGNIKSFLVGGSLVGAVSYEGVTVEVDGDASNEISQVEPNGDFVTEAHSYPGAELSLKISGGKDIRSGSIPLAIQYDDNIEAVNMTVRVGKEIPTLEEVEVTVRSNQSATSENSITSATETGNDDLSGNTPRRTSSNPDSQTQEEPTRSVTAEPPHTQAPNESGAVIIPNMNSMTSSGAFTTSGAREGEFGEEPSGAIILQGPGGDFNSPASENDPFADTEETRLEEPKKAEPGFTVSQD